MTRAQHVALDFKVHGLKYAALAWGNPDNPPLLALHGWLDNAASFSLLAPHLSDFYVLALDLSGHGQSDRRSGDATYQVYDDLPQIAAIVDELGWSRFYLLGHSRGAIISTLFAATFPERVGKLILLDAVVPPALEEEHFATQMRNFITDKARLLPRKTRVYKSIGTAINSREEQGLSREAATLITTRNLTECEGGYTWTTDPRLRGASAVKLTPGQTHAVLQRISMPTLLLLARRGLGESRPEMLDAARSIDGLVQEWINGGHHFHMEQGVATLGARIQQFLLQQ